MMNFSCSLSFFQKYLAQPSLERLAYAFSVLLLLIPVWVSDFPPFFDIPLHAAQVSEFLNYVTGDRPSSFTINLFTPYIFGYVLATLFACVMPLIAAIKFTLSLAIIGFVVSCCWLRREVGGKPCWDWLVLPTAYSFSLDWGFFNFILGTPVAIFLVTESLNRLRSTVWRNEITILALSLLLFFSHVILYAFFWGLAFLVLSSRVENFRDWFRRVRPLLLSAILVPMWLLVIASGDAKMIQGVFWGWTADRLTDLLVLPYLWPSDAAHIAASVFLLAFPLLTGGRMAWRRGPCLAAIAFLAGFMFLPNGAYGASLVFQRFAVFLIPFWLLFFVPRSDDTGPSCVPGWQKMVTASMICLICILSGSLVYRKTVGYMALSEEFSDFRVVMDQMRPNARVLSLPFDHGSEQVSGRFFAHFASWYQAFKGGSVDPSAGVLYHMLARYRPEHLPPVRLGFEDAVSTFDWMKHGGDEYDYFVVHSLSERRVTEFDKSVCPISLIDHVGHWWLYAPVRTKAHTCDTRRHQHQNLMFGNVMRSRDFPTTEKEFDVLHLDPRSPLSNMGHSQWKQVNDHRLFELDMDLAADRGKTDFKTTYVYAEIDAGPTALSARLELGSDDGLTVWQEGNRIVYAPNVLRAAQWGDHMVTVSLQPGINHFLFRINNAAGGWRLLGRAVATVHP